MMCQDDIFQMFKMLEVKPGVKEEVENKNGPISDPLPDTSKTMAQSGTRTFNVVVKLLVYL